MIVKANLIACVILGDSRTKKCNVITKGNRDWKGLSVFPLKTFPFLFPGLENMIWEVEISYKIIQALCSIPVTMMLNLKNSNLQKGHSTLQIFFSCLIMSSWQGSLYSSALQGLLIPLHSPRTPHISSLQPFLLSKSGKCDVSFPPTTSFKVGIVVGKKTRCGLGLWSRSGEAWKY